MDKKTEAERRRVTSDAVTAVAAVACFAGIPKQNEELDAAYLKYGIAIAAFLRLPEVQSLSFDQLSGVFTAAYCAQGEGRKDELRDLVLKRKSWEGPLRSFYANVDVDGLHQWDDQAFREVFNANFVMSYALGWCFIFELAPIRAALER